MLAQLAIMPYEIWYRTTGLAFPLFIIIIGLVYGFIPSAESEEEFFRRIIEPRVINVSDEERIRVLKYKKEGKAFFFIAGYLYAIIFQLIWTTLVNMGDIAVLGLFMMVPSFAMLVAVGSTPFVVILERVRYRDIKHILDVEREYLKSWTRGNI
jgi:hypothetical protein